MYNNFLPRGYLGITYSLLGKFCFRYFNNTKLFASTVVLKAYHNVLHVLVCSLYGFLSIAWHTSGIAGQTFFVLSIKCYFSANMESLNKSLFSVNYRRKYFKEVHRWAFEWGIPWTKLVFLSTLRCSLVFLGWYLVTLIKWSVPMSIRNQIGYLQLGVCVTSITALPRHLSQTFPYVVTVYLDK